MTGDVWEVATLCRCGKRGWTERSDAGRAVRVMKSRTPKGPRRDQLNMYVCARTGSGLWHVGHDRSAVAS